LRFVCDNATSRKNPIDHLPVLKETMGRGWYVPLLVNQGRKNYGSNHNRPENKGLGPATEGIVAVQGFHEVSRAEGPKGQMG
jgi:hypothetical protein